MRTGDLVGDRYRLGPQIGAGGMAAVFEALDVTLHRRVAAKFLTARHRNPATVERRFLREARIAAAVRHPNVVEVYDFGVADDTPFMIMELLRGASLADRTVEPPVLTLGELFDVIDGVLAGLTAVHEAGIVHRDLKPENIFLADGPDGATVPKVFDFGVSKIQTDDGPISASTSVEGYLVGTPHYMSSEQARGLRELDPTTDVYSLGVVLYEHLVGQLPFDAEHMGDLVIAIATKTPSSVRELRPELGDELSDFIDRAMSKLPEERWSSAAEMRGALRAIRDAHPELDDLPTRTVVRTVEHPHLAATIDPPDEVPLPWDDAPLEVDYGLPDEPEAVVPGTPPPAAKPMWPWAAAVAAALALAVGTGVFLSTRPSDVAATPPSNAPVTEAIVAPAPTPQVRVRLVGIPRGARVELDQSPVRGSELSMARDDSEHRLRVEADAMEPFETSFVADADRTVRVELSPTPADSPEPDPRPAPTSTRRRRRADGPPSDTGTGGGGIFRQPDF
ncbi:MAG: protein kinase [Myxococcales bacterium]|nr:protein kinase [Myxococcales bacterium]